MAPTLAKTLTGTAAALGTMDGLEILGFPFTALKFTKSAATENATVVIGVSRRLALIKISGLTTETIAVTAVIDGTAESGALCVRVAAGTFSSSAALGNGTYVLVLS